MCCFVKQISAIFRQEFMERRNTKNNYIFYKIVESYQYSFQKYYTIQCINTKAIFPLTLEEIVFDSDILYGLHPAQGCYVGIQYAVSINRVGVHPMTDSFTQPRYGKYLLLYQNREGLLGFCDKQTGEEYLLDPREIASSSQWIEEFDTIQAFYIGILTGVKFINTMRQPQKRGEYLRLIKG